MGAWYPDHWAITDVTFVVTSTDTGGEYEMIVMKGNVMRGVEEIVESEDN